MLTQTCTAFVCRWPDCGRRFARHDNCSQHVRLAYPICWALLTVDGQLRTHKEKGQSEQDFAARIEELYNRVDGKVSWKSK